MDNLLDIPLSLQDMCMLCIVFQIEDFPVQSLALLPHEIRRKLLFGLSHADVLHLADTTLFDDVDSNRDYPQVSHARQCLVDVILSGGQILSLQLKNALKWFSREEYRYDFRAESSLFDHICKCYPSLKPTKINTGYSKYCILPKRSLPFVQQEGVVDIYDVTIPTYVELVVLPSSLLNYCNVHSAPTELKIDCHNFQSSAVWKEFDKVVETAFNASRDERGYPIKGANTKVDLVIPVLQEFLSSVEVLALGTASTPSDADDLEEVMHTVPFLLLYNVLSSSKPRLKHLKVYGIPLFADWVLKTLMELIDGNCTSTKSVFTEYRGVEVLSPLTTPYLLEGISISPGDRDYGYGFDYMLTSYASSLSCGVMSIVENHKEKLKSVAVNDLGYCYHYDNLNIRDLEDRIQYFRGKRNINVPSYRALLSSFIQFVKRPPFTDLSVGKSPLPEAYELIEAFLCTPAVHEQSLTIKASSERSVPEMEKLEDEIEDKEQEEEEEEQENEEDEDEENNQETMETGSTLEEDSRKRELVTELSDTPSQKIMKPTSPVLEPPSFTDQPLPETNIQYKCLDLGFSSSCVYSWLFTIPELKLKKLRMRTQDMTIVPTDMVILVEHVAFTTEDHISTSYKPTITPAHLEKFIVSNSALKRLEFLQPIDESVPDLIPALNHCLSTLYQQGRGLEKLILNAVEFQNIEHMKEFFIRVRDLSHRHGTILVLSLKYTYKLINSFEEDSTIFEDLSKDFQEKKIKKIDCTIWRDCDQSSYLSLIAEIVDIHISPYF